MNDTKIFAKICLTIHVIAGLWMVVQGLYTSFSQHSTSTNDWALRLYLHSGAWTFLVLTLCAKRKQNALYLGWAKIRHWHIWLVIAASFVGVSATNVIDYSLPDPNMTDPTKVVLHYIFTGLLALSATFFAWHYYQRGTEDRELAMMSCSIGGLAFGLSVLGTKLGWSLLSISLGELIISTTLALVVWPVINEQLN